MCGIVSIKFNFVSGFLLNAKNIWNKILRQIFGFKSDENDKWIRLYNEEPQGL